MSVSDSAGRGARSSRKRPTSSAARWVASAALPPLPNSSSLPPSRSASTTRSASPATRSGIGDSISARLASMLSPMRLRTSLVSARGRIAKRPLVIDAPRGQAVRGELELRHGASHPDEGVRHAVLAMEGAEEQHVAAPSRTGDLAAQRAGRQRGVVRLVDEARGDAGRHLLLELPGGAQQLAELGQPPPQQRVLHLPREALLHPQPLEGRLVALL